jgi:RNA polymerase sigma factor (TIGR02999 family)
LREIIGKTVMDSRSAQLSGGGGSTDAIFDGIEQAALDTIFSATYEELRRLAATVRRSDVNATLSPTTLVNEAWLRLSRNPPAGFASKLHFKRIAARAMRQVLVDSARRKNAMRHGGQAALVTLDDGIEQMNTDAAALLGLDDALRELAQINPRQAAMIEARFFGGLDVAETAELLGVSEATILRDWRAARAWLSLQLRTT